jgi:hypothetical protein
MYASVNGLVGTAPIQLSGLTVDAVPRVQPGLITPFTDPWWGFGEFMYARAAGAIPAFNLASFLPVFDSTLNSYRYDATAVANTANLGRSVAVAVKTMALGDYGWFQISGLCPVSCNASVAADTSFGIAAAGQGGAVAAGKQILNARVVVAAAATVVKAGCNTIGLSTTLQVPNSDGWFVGAYLSGTGIAGGTTIASISADGRYVTMSAASTAAIVGGSITATYNNGVIFYNVAHFNRPFAQGAIT